MSMLHTVNKSPFEKSSLVSCLAHAKAGSAVLLIEDGVYGAMKNSTVAEAVQNAQQNVKVYALKADLDTRGIGENQVLNGIELVDYAGFVDLATQHDKVQSWL